MSGRSFEVFPKAAIAVDPVHVGTGGARLGRVDNTIVRDPVTRVPKIPGSSLAGVLRSYVAMQEETGRDESSRPKPYYPDCAGQGQPRQDGSGGHCGQPDCRVCTVFGFARGGRGGFAGLASFSDAHVLLFPVATREGPLWVTAPSALRLLDGLRDQEDVAENKLYRNGSSDQPLNLGWLLLPVQKYCKMSTITDKLKNMHIPEYIRNRMGIVSDKLFSHVVNSNLEVRTSVAIDPATGAAEEGLLFTYEALPRGTVVLWEITCRNPAHCRIGKNEVAVRCPADVHQVVTGGFPYLEALGIGGMGSRGMGRLRVLNPDGKVSGASQCNVSKASQGDP
ncbi:MAG: type III-B CRISPR module RAMP protein Cmr4 [Planctomycetota bacterium]|nr:MAG: type III-B CRISPR module RAMP protein Cmr4 [Planctomycetota bacterium]